LRRLLKAGQRGTQYATACLSGNPLAYVGGWLGHGNLGDEALYLATARIFGDCSLWHYDASRTATALMELGPRIHHGVLAGGTLINRCPEYLDISRKFMRAGKMYVFGTGVAHPDFWSKRSDFQNMLSDWVELLRACPYVGVRGPISAQLLFDAGLTGVQVVGDPALVFATQWRSQQCATKTLGINVGYDHGHQWGDARVLSDEMGRLAVYAADAGWAIKWFVVFPGDLAITEQIALASSEISEIQCIYEDPQAFIDEVSRVSVFIGMKLHATMLAACAGVPCLMLEYDPKCLDFMASIGQSDAVVRTDEVNAEILWDTLRSWEQDRHRLSSKIHTAVLELKAEQTARATCLSSVMLEK